MSRDTLTSYAELAEVLANLPLLVREARRARGLSLRAAARQMDIASSTLMRFEQGETGCHSPFLIVLLSWLDSIDPRPSDADIPEDEETVRLAAWLSTRHEVGKDVGDRRR